MYHIIAAALFVWGWRHQFRCMVILGLLRDQQPTKPVGSQRHQSSYAYRIPHGDWFEIVSSPHYLAEVIIYTAVFLVMGGKNHYWLLVVLFVITILSVSARQTHAWYKRTFRGYPAERYVIFPRIYWVLSISFLWHLFISYSCPVLCFVSCTYNDSYFLFKCCFFQNESC